jgi:hypothetical protein
MLSLGLAFWILMLLWLVLSCYWYWPTPHVVGGNVLLFVLLGLLGWHVFGPPLHS